MLNRLLTVFFFTLPLTASPIEYSYAGNDFTTFTANHGAYTGADFVSGYFTVASPLADNMTLTGGGTDITVLSFSFTDGVQTFNADSGHDHFDIATDANGNITQWNIGVNLTPPNFVATSNVLNDGGSCICDAGNSGIQIQAEVDNNPGTWVSNAPEPGDLTLAGTGLAVIAFLRRRLRHC